LRRTASRKVEVVEYPELGMEAIWKIEVEDFPAFIVIDDKGNDFFKELKGDLSSSRTLSAPPQRRHQAPSLSQVVGSRPGFR
jgi:tartrate dehydratase beta subunit/fumarate hydratase class I family protein